MISHLVVAPTRSSVVADTLDRSLILGSASPRRAELLTILGVPFQVQTVDIDEAILVTPGSDNVALSVEDIATAKFRAFGAAHRSPAPWLLTADTLVACEGETLGKPDSADHLSDMLAHMSGRVVTIVTAVCLGIQGTEPVPHVVTTLVQLRTLGAAQIRDYVATNAGADKAGGLALQSEAHAFMASVDGCWSNVVGLPVCAVAAGLNLASTEQSQAERCSFALCGTHRR